jgi:hypothetical protein
MEGHALHTTNLIHNIKHSIERVKQVYLHPWFKDLHKSHIQSISWISRPSTMVIKSLFFKSNSWCINWKKQ